MFIKPGNLSGNFPVCVRTIEIIDIECVQCVLHCFLSQNLSPQNGGFMRALFARPNLFGREFCAVARSVIVFLSSHVYKNILNWRL